MTITPEERAKDLVGRPGGVHCERECWVGYYLNLADYPDDEPDGEPRDCACLDRVAAAIRAAENDALERAAKCFDMGGSYWLKPDPIGKGSYIRALKHGDPE